jgi:hypothetical protein
LTDYIYFSLLLNCYGLEQLEDVSGFCIFEVKERRERKLARNEKERKYCMWTFSLEHWHL